MVFLAPILSFLRMIPLWVFAIALALAWGGWQRHRATSAAEIHQKAQIEAATKTEAALAENIRETARRLAEQQKATQHAELQTVKARAAAVAASGAAGRLRDRLESIRAASASASSPGTYTAGQADRLAELFGQCVDRYRTVADAADRAVIAGRTCEASYDSLTK